MTTAVTDPTMDLIERYIETRDPDAREQLVTNYLPLVRSIARRFRNSREPMEDLVQMGTIGLLSAIEKFDMSHGVRFASLAIPEVYGAILNHLRDHGGLVKVPRALRHNRISLDRCTERLISHFGRWPTTAEMATESGLTEDASTRLWSSPGPAIRDHWTRASTATSAKRGAHWSRSLVLKSRRSARPSIEWCCRAPWTSFRCGRGRLSR